MSEYADLLMDTMIADLIPICEEVVLEGTLVLYRIRWKHNIDKARAICEAQPGELTWQFVEW